MSSLLLGRLSPKGEKNPLYQGMCWVRKIKQEECRKTCIHDKPFHSSFTDIMLSYDHAPLSFIRNVIFLNQVSEQKQSTLRKYVLKIIKMNLYSCFNMFTIFRINRSSWGDDNDILLFSQVPYWEIIISYPGVLVSSSNEGNDVHRDLHGNPWVDLGLQSCPWLARADTP